MATKKQEAYLRNKTRFFLMAMASVMALSTTTSTAFAQQASPATNPVTSPTKNDDPIEITADKSLEWNREKQQFFAYENAKVTQGNTSITADTLQADYREGNGSNMDIYHMIATDNVVIRSADNTMYGDKADYDLEKGLAVMTGQNLRITSPEQTVTATERFEYWTQDGRFEAIGNAKVVRPKPQGGQDTLTANKIAAFIVENAQGNQALQRMEATGNVVITTPTETITGAKGIYNAQTDKADLTGGVKIKRGPNVLEGERAEVDLKTNTSRIFGSGTSTGRVRGVFYPNSEKKPSN